MSFNRYYDNSVLVKFDEGDLAIIPQVRALKPNTGDNYHEVKQGDTLEYIAGLYYKQAKSWYVIAQANDIMNPFDLTPGAVLRIPAESNET